MFVTNSWAANSQLDAEVDVFCFKNFQSESFSVTEELKQLSCIASLEQTTSFARFLIRLTSSSSGCRGGWCPPIGTLATPSGANLRCWNMIPSIPCLSSLILSAGWQGGWSLNPSLDILSHLFCLLFLHISVFHLSVDHRLFVSLHCPCHLSFNLRLIILLNFYPTEANCYISVITFLGIKLFRAGWF